eukprot:CAMPEP_0115580938 /NCGR_PEP_ID=MMETSP0272-20121206/4892_1 /TAXON_ID=71861 /ORGANISM="Scrippsiella trochoidea, Strain CCMP3099" /LENGTH=104 /DNA_ID=CAMNT_0003015889 /DNA_START=330 /DNA_END=641 /DNA_ORIENTATION=+
MFWRSRKPTARALLAANHQSGGGQAAHADAGVLLRAPLLHYGGSVICVDVDADAADLCFDEVMDLPICVSVHHLPQPMPWSESSTTRKQALRLQQHAHVARGRA